MRAVLSLLFFAALTLARASERRPRLLGDPVALKARCGDNETCYRREYRKARRAVRPAKLAQASATVTNRICAPFDNGGFGLMTTSTGPDQISCQYQDGFCTYDTATGAIVDANTVSGCNDHAPTAVGKLFYYECPSQDKFGVPLRLEQDSAAGSQQQYCVCTYGRDAPQQQSFYCVYNQGDATLALDHDNDGCPTTAQTRPTPGGPINDGGSDAQPSSA